MKQPPRRYFSKSPRPAEAVPANAAAMALLNTRQSGIIFWSALGLLVANWLRNLSFPIESQMGYWIIGAAALTPLSLWCNGRVPGFPIYPAFVVFQFFAFGAPLLSKHPGIIAHSPSSHLAAAWIVAAALTAGTLGWLMVGRRLSAPPPRCLQLNKTGGSRILQSVIFLNILFTLNTIVPLVYIPYQYLSIFRGIIGGVSSLALFVIGQYWGLGRLSPPAARMFFLLTTALFFVQISSLLLINALTVVALALGGYILGSRRIPWLPLAAIITVISFLHLGKAPVRERYWGPKRESLVHSLGDLMEMYSFWINCSLRAFGEKQAEEDETAGSAFQRASLMHLLLMQKSMIDSGHPLMFGQTYILIPQLLVPRILDPDKPWSQEGTTLLNIHFGIQSREESMVTTIGWGLLNESYANFALAGSLGVFFLIGVLYGWASRLSQGFPFLSFRSLASILLLSTTFQTEFSMGVLVTVLFQSFAGFTFFSLLFMRIQPTMEIVRFIAPAPRKHDKAPSPHPGPKP